MIMEMWVNELKFFCRFSFVIGGSWIVYRLFYCGLVIIRGDEFIYFFLFLFVFLIVVFYIFFVFERV